MSALDRLDEIITALDRLDHNVVSITNGNETVNKETHFLDTDAALVTGIRPIHSVVLGNKTVVENLEYVGSNLGSKIVAHAVPGELKSNKTTYHSAQSYADKIKNNAPTAEGPADAPLGSKYEHGLAMLINNMFDKREDQRPKFVNKDIYREHRRDGADEDTRLIQKRFQELTGEPVYIAENVSSKDELEYYLEDFKKQVSEKKPDYIVVVVSTHGGTGNQLLLDNLKTVDLYDDVVYQFDDKHFPGFDIPKIFLIQACQKGDLRALSADAPRYAPRDRLQEPEVKTSRSKIFVGQSTVPNDYSYRAQTGSLYIRAIYNHFTKGKALEAMLQEVDAEVNRICQGQRMEQSTYISKVPDFPLDFAFGSADS